MDAEEAKRKFGLRQFNLNVISGVVAGYSLKEIGERLNLTTESVAVLATMSCEKLNAANLEELKRFAIDHELPLTKLPPKP